MVSVTECGISFVSFPLACTLLSICSASDIYFVIWYRFSDCKYSPNNICKCISLCVSVCVMCILILLCWYYLVCFVLFICGFVLRSRFDLFQKRAAFNISVGFEWFNHIAKKSNIVARTNTKKEHKFSAIGRGDRLWYSVIDQFHARVWLSYSMKPEREKENANPKQKV